MRNILIPVFFIALIFSACDKIETTRESNTRGTVLSENSVLIGNDTLTVVEDFLSASKHVLVEEFTGHLCGTCPPAAVVLYDSLRLQFGVKLITIAVHAGQFSDTCPTALDCPSGAPVGSFEINYRSIVGDGWATQFGITVNPLAMINRIGFPTSHKKTYTTWKTNIQNELALPAVAKINLQTYFDSSGQEAKVAVKVELLQPLSDSLALQVVMVEDNIVDWQQWYSHSPQYVPNYTHHDILRASFNGLNGENFRPNAENKLLTGYSLPFSSKWVAGNCKVIAFLYKKSNYIVLQVAEKSLE